MEHIQDKGDTLAQGDETDHDGQHGGQQADDLIQDTADHIGSDNSGQDISSSFLSLILLSQDSWLRAMESNHHLRVQSPVCFLYTNPRHLQHV